MHCIGSERWARSNWIFLTQDPLVQDPFPKLKSWFHFSTSHLITLTLKCSQQFKSKATKLSAQSSKTMFRNCFFVIITIFWLTMKRSCLAISSFFFCGLGTRRLAKGRMTRQKTPKPLFFCPNTLPEPASLLTKTPLVVQYHLLQIESWQLTCCYPFLPPNTRSWC